MGNPYPTQDSYSTERRYFLDEGYIVVVVGDNNVTNRSLDLWAGMMLETFKHFADPTYIYLLLDLRQITEAFNTYSRVTAADVIHRMEPHRKLCLAVLSEQEVVTTVTATFLERLNKQIPGKFVHKSFSHFDDAVAWLRAQRHRNNSQ